LLTLTGASQARPELQTQLCALGFAVAGQPGAIICKNVATGATTQVIAVGNTVVGSGATGGTFSRRDDHVLVTNLVSGALLFEEQRGRLRSPLTLQTNEATLSGALGERGAYVLTGTHLLFFPVGATKPASRQPLLVGDGSAAQVTLAGGFAYVSEKTGTLEAFPLDKNGVIGPGSNVGGVPAGAIVGIVGHDDLVVAPVAHLATNANQSTIPVVSGTALAQLVPTKEVAACWTANDDDEVCVSNPGSMTLSCGHIGPGGFTTYTSAAASPAGESLFDLDVRGSLVGVLGKHNGALVLATWIRSAADSDFLTFVSESSIDTSAATGALLLPPLSR
jgi:hypothetical protein